jgi:transposase, IS30 family
MRGYHQLTLNHRYQIQRWIKRGLSKDQIAKKLGVHRSTVYREVKRNSYLFPFDGLEYDAYMANTKAFEKRCERRRRFKKIRGNLQKLVEEKIRSGWSPEQISGRLKIEGIANISHETIYRHILHDSYGYGDLFKYLRVWRYKKSRFSFKSIRRRPKIKSGTSIQHRPKEANNRTELGHWERDLVIGSEGAEALLTVVDRKSRFTIIRKVSNKRTSAVFKTHEQSL